MRMSPVSIITTSDASKSLLHTGLNESYHSYYGALSESQLVFLSYGFHYQASQLQTKTIRILEYGFGTGLNALLVLKHSIGMQIYYTALELYPVNWELIRQLHYTTAVEAEEFDAVFREMHLSEWDQPLQLTPNFCLLKRKMDFKAFQAEPSHIDLIFFDAFSPDKQPELWSEEVFGQACQALRKGGVLVTYSSKGWVKQNLRKCGFDIERLPGPKGKRHVLRAVKPV